MKGVILSIDEYGRESATEINGPPSLDLLKKAIGGGLLEVVPYFLKFEYLGKTHSCVAFCDEEGKLNDLPFNAVATNHWNQQLKAVGITHNPDCLVGKIAIVWGDKAFMEAL